MGPGSLAHVDSPAVGVETGMVAQSVWEEGCWQDLQLFGGREICRARRPS